MGLRDRRSGGQKKSLVLFFLLFAPFLFAPASWGEQDPAVAVLENRCSGCHAPRDEGGKLEMIEFQRKTPEGWEMTIDRMIRVHGVQLQPGEGRTLVKYLSDRYGLAPAEVEPFQFVLERRINTAIQPEIPAVIRGACGQCHSYARPALQRRTPEMWNQLADLKLALFLNTENVTGSSGLLHDFWYAETKKEVVPYLAEKYPFASEAWAAWQARPKPDYAGHWKVVGHDPGKGGAYVGRLTLHALGDDQYEGEFTHEFSDGNQVSGKTTAVVYTGFQWRGAARSDSGARQREIFFASEDGTGMRGRRLLSDLGDLGRDEALFKDNGGAKLLTVIPAALRAGGTYTVKLFGMNFPRDLTAEMLSFGEGVSAQSVQVREGDTIVAEVVVAQDAEVAPRQVKVLGVEGKFPLYIYRNIDYIRLVPEQAFSRPGGTQTPKILQQFEVFGYLNGPDGVKGSDDDVKLDRVEPVQWKLEEYVRRSNDDDVQFVGHIDQTGLFTPANDGPNPQRHMSEHNVGDVWVEAWYKPEGAKRPMGARAFLLVMPEKFSFQPIE